MNKPINIRIKGIFHFSLIVTKKRRKRFEKATKRDEAPTPRKGNNRSGTAIVATTIPR